jgi:proteasome lid subunit RPN8/RPN11
LTTLQIPQPASGLRRESQDKSVWLDGRQGIVEISWRLGLLEQVRSYVCSTYISRSGKGSDVGGVLFGKRDGECVQVVAWRPILRGKESTSHFYLDTREELTLIRFLKSAHTEETLADLEVVGWFRSRTKGAPELEEHDIRFHEKFFEGGSQFAMVIRPSHQRPADASIYVRNKSNEFEPSQPSATLSLQPAVIGTADVDEDSSMIPGVAIDGVGQSAVSRFPWKFVMSLAFVGALLAVGAILALQWNQERETAALASDQIGLELVFDGEGLKARWNPSSSIILRADNAQLLLGGEKLQLSHSELAQGFLRIPMKTGVISDTEISFKVGDREEVAQLVVAPR